MSCECVPAVVPGAVGFIEHAVRAEAFGVAGAVGDSDTGVDVGDERIDDPAVDVAEFEELVRV